LPKERDLRLDDIEQLEDDGGDAAEMTGAEFAIENILDSRRLDDVFLRLRVKIGFGRCKQHIDAGGSQLVAIGLEGARIFVEILVRAELQAIDENAERPPCRRGPGLLHQADVAGVQVAHRRDENDAAAPLERRA
jgi:hypothetical protein